MRELFNNSIKKLQERPRLIGDILMLSTYFTIITLSFKNNNLFLKELAICGLIILFALVGTQLKNKK